MIVTKSYEYTYVHQKTREDSILSIHTKNRPSYNVTYKRRDRAVTALNPSITPTTPNELRYTVRYLNSVNIAWKSIMQNLNAMWNNHFIKLTYVEKKYLSLRVGTSITRPYHLIDLIKL